MFDLQAKRAIFSVPLPGLNDIEFTPALPNYIQEVGIVHSGKNYLQAIYAHLPFAMIIHILKCVLWWKHGYHCGKNV